MNEIFARAYAKLVHAGAKTIDEVPEKLRSAVLDELEKSYE